MSTGGVQKGCREHLWATVATRYPQVKGLETGHPLGGISWIKCSPLFELRTGAFNKEPGIIMVLWEMRENIKVQEFMMWPFESKADQMPGL